MAKTTSIKFPNMFNVVQNKVDVLSDKASVTNRCRLLILTEPTSLYNSPDFGVGLKRHLWQYNNNNQIELIKNRIVSQLALHEPYVVAENTQVENGLLLSDPEPSVVADYNTLKLTVGLVTTFGDTTEVEF